MDFPLPGNPVIQIVQPFALTKKPRTKCFLKRLIRETLDIQIEALSNILYHLLNGNTERREQITFEK
jgi:hypothetical protein